MQKIREEIIPLNGRQNTVLLIIIACIFQFVLFYAPVLADEAVNQAKNHNNNQEILSVDAMTKEPVMDQEAAKLAKPVVLEPITATTTPATTTPVVSTLATTTPVTKVIRTSVHVITAYNSEVGQTDDSPCITANGYNLCEKSIEDTIAANFLKFGTKVKIPELFGDRVFVVRDRMNKKHPNRVDVWMNNRHDAIHFGVKTAQIEIIE
jgi:3D (Asp-Asp-Asp) domain-containing protein